MDQLQYAQSLNTYEQAREQSYEQAREQSNKRLLVRELNYFSQTCDHACLWGLHQYLLTSPSQFTLEHKLHF